MTLRVVVAEDTVLMRTAIRTILAAEEDVEIVAECADLPEALAALAKHDPDVLLTDIRMPPSKSDEGIRAAHAALAGRGDVGVVVLSQFAEPEYAAKLFEDGVQRRAYMLKDNVVDDLAKVVRAVASGFSFVDPAVSAVLARRVNGVKTGLEIFTPGQLQVLELMAQSKTNSAIADALFLSSKTVENRINDIYRLIDANDGERQNRVYAVLYYLSHSGGLTRPL